MTLVELVICVDAALDEDRLPHAFGGALALAYVAEPRGTADADVNVFAPVDEVGPVTECLARTSLTPEPTSTSWMPAAGLRFRHSRSPFAVDVFLSLDEHYDEVRSRVVRRPFGPDAAMLPFLSAEDLVVFKLSFGRAKDWVDLSSIAATTGDLDIAYVERQLLALRGPAMHPRLARMRALLAGG
ncbi:MAG TPA: hypothetical protein VM142_07940 [Acidimicrobiales bacterium]|nr:hypothetical protein [Acidimicrobiales bacterium]